MAAHLADQLNVLLSISHNEISQTILSPPCCKQLKVDSVIAWFSGLPHSLVDSNTLNSAFFFFSHKSTNKKCDVS